MTMVAGALLLGPGLGFFMLLLIVGLLAMAGAGRRPDHDRPVRPVPPAALTRAELAKMPTDEVARQAVRYHEATLSMYDELRRRQSPPADAAWVRPGARPLGGQQ